MKRILFVGDGGTRKDLAHIEYDPSTERFRETEYHFTKVHKG